MSTAADMKQEIAKILDMKPELLIYHERLGKDGRHVLDLTTISPNKHRTKFIFHTTVVDSAVEALNEM